MAKFPEASWLQALEEKLNTDEKYAQVARNWEGDMLCVIEPNGALKETLVFYLDLWHGKCRSTAILENGANTKAVLTLKAPYDQYVRLINNELEPMQALLTRKVSVQGNMALLMRNVPVVLDFVRCCREITTGYW
jgi:putative sterol carrier protein